MSIVQLVTLGLLAALALPGNARADQYAVQLGGRVLGTITYDAGAQTLVSVLDNTPLGVGDGRFEATSRPVRTAEGAARTQYIGRSDDRVISVLFDGARAVETVVEPASERTPMSDAAQVPEGVMDLARGFGRMTRADGCPGRFAMYDGRRVIDVATVAEARAEGSLTCELAYRVVGGPGHLSPFRFTSIAITLEFSTAGGQALERATVRAGVFTVALVR